MAGTQDASFGFSATAEGSYGAAAAIGRWVEYLDESIDFVKNIKQGKGLRVGSRVARSGRRVVTSADVAGDVSYELTSKGLGPLYDAGFGASTVTLVAGTTFQHVFTLTQNTTAKSLTGQKGLPEAGGTVDPYTVLGMCIAAMEFSMPNDDIGQVKFTLDGKDLSTATAYAAPSYPAAPTLYSFNNWTISTGVLTAPTATALAAMATPVADFRDGSVSINRNLKGDRLNGGGGGRKTVPTVGLADITGTATVEYDSTTYRDAVLNDTPMGLLFQYTGAALSTGVETIQLVLPEVKFDSELAKTNGTDLINQSMKFDVLDNLTAAQPIWLVVRTSESAL